MVENTLLLPPALKSALQQSRPWWIFGKAQTGSTYCNFVLHFSGMMGTHNFYVSLVRC